MEEQPNNKLYKVVVMMLVVGVVVGFFADQIAMGQKLAVMAQKYDTLAGRVKSAIPPTPPQMLLEGPVKSVGDNEFTIEVPQSGNPFEEWPTLRTVRVTLATVLVHERMVRGGTAIAPGNVRVPVNNVEYVQATFGEIKEGSMIRVEAAQDIKTLSEFEATRVIFPS